MTSSFIIEVAIFILKNLLEGNDDAPRNGQMNCVSCSSQKKKNVY